MSSNQDKLESFLEKYKIKSNEQQKEAVKAINGPYLILAVPGSGKTTTLVARIGYMCVCEKINPKSILAITYTKNAAKEMKIRLSNKFGNYVDGVDVRTINSLGEKLCNEYLPDHKIIDDDERQKLLGELYFKANEEFASELELKDIQRAITYIKNMSISLNDIKDNEWSINNISLIYKDYQDYLKLHKQYDYDDQIRYSLYFLRKDIKRLRGLQNQFKYICVDESQDTSKIQHELINLIAEKNKNIFMVGDEDQSIYGFRGAYPKALFEFKDHYKDARILKLEINYRSCPEITNIASAFICRNTDREKKEIISNSDKKGSVKCTDVKGRFYQYIDFINKCKEDETEEITALYRNNDTAVLLVYLLTINNIPFNLNNYSDSFFNSSTYKEVVSFFKFVSNLNDEDAFMSIYNKLNLYFTKEFSIKVCKFAKKNDVDILTGLLEVSKKEKNINQRNVGNFIDVFKNANNESLKDIWKKIKDLGYIKYRNEKKRKDDKLYVLDRIISNCKTTKQFLYRMKELEEVLTSKKVKKNNSNILLSTIHSAKGMEFDHVYIIDTYDDIYLNDDSNRAPKEVLEEARRLFYVAITRAKTSIVFYRDSNKDQQFIDEIFEYKYSKEHAPKLDYEKTKIRKAVKKNKNIIKDIEGGKTFFNIINSSNERFLTLHCLSNGNDYLIKINRHEKNGPNYKFLSFIINKKTGEISEASANPFIMNNIDKKIWIISK